MSRTKFSVGALLILFLVSSFFTSQLKAQWTPQNSGIPTEDQVVLVAVNENVCWGVNRATGGSWVTRTTNGGEDWVASNLTSLNFFSSIAALSADTAWISANGSIYNTTNGGLNWMEQLTTSNRLMLIVRFFDSNNGVCMGDGSGGNPEIYTTLDGGTNWNQVSSSNIPDFINNEGFIPANSWVVDNTIWVPTNGGFTGPGSLYKSTNWGLTWEVTRSVNDGGGSFCAFKDTLNGLLSGGASATVKRTTDGGATWDTTETKPVGISTLFMSYIPGAYASYIICATPPHGPSPGSAYTLDNGKTWAGVDLVNHGKAAFVSPSVGWSWGGANIIYKWTGIPLPVENTNVVTMKFRLEQNYPNPFNPSTKIKYTIPSVIASGSKQTQLVILKVYDVLGHEVTTLVNEEKPAGSYEVEFNAAELSSGIYFYSLQVGSYTQTKKLILMK